MKRGKKISIYLDRLLKSVACRIIRFYDYRAKHAPKPAPAGEPWRAIEGIVSIRVYRRVMRCYKDGRLGKVNKPLSELTDRELFRCSGIGVGGILEIRRVFPPPENNVPMKEWGQF